MSDKTYNGWTNYQTWRVNLEMLDGIDPNEMGWRVSDPYDLAKILTEYCIDILESYNPTYKRTDNNLVLSFALAFLSEVNWLEIANHMIEDYDLDKDEDEETEA